MKGQSCFERNFAIVCVKYTYESRMGFDCMICILVIKKNGETSNFLVEIRKNQLKGNYKLPQILNLVCEKLKIIVRCKILEGTMKKYFRISKSILAYQKRPSK